MFLRRSGILLAACLGVVLCQCVYAHHGVNPEDGIPITFEGEIVVVSWDGPHVMYRIQVKNQTGLQTWQVLGASPKILRARNIEKGTLQRGERVTVSGWLDPYSKIVAPEYFVTQDGRRYQMGFYPKAMTPARTK